MQQHMHFLSFPPPVPGMDGQPYLQPMPGPMPVGHYSQGPTPTKDQLDHRIGSAPEVQPEQRIWTQPEAPHTGAKAPQKIFWDIFEVRTAECVHISDITLRVTSRLTPHNRSEGCSQWPYAAARATRKVEESRHTHPHMSL